MLAVENGCNGCWEKERIALLQLKDSINFPNGTSLPSWEEDDYLDCCQWERVTCNSSTRRVIKLSLVETTRDSWYWSRELNYSWYLNASILLPFEYLQSLDLSWNGLHGFHGNEGIGILSNLSNLKILNLADNILNGSISINGIGTLSNLSNLEELDLSSNLLGNSILPSLNKLSNLKILNLARTRLNGSISINEFDGLNNLKELDLSSNEVASMTIVTEFDGLNNLKKLDLSWNRLRSIITVNGSQEESGILNELEVLDLSYNYYLNDSIWSFLKELSSIKTLDLSSNHGLHRAIHRQFIWDWDIYKRPTLPLSLENRYADHTYTPAVQEVEFETKRMTLSYTGNVLYLISGINLAHNRLTGPIPPEIGNLSHIEVLNFSHNHLTGTIPATFSKLKSIESLDLSYNHLSGKIPSQLTELYSLEVFDLSNNNLSGRTPQRVFQFATFESSSYDGNPLLCGEPLLKKCNADYSPPPMPRAAINGTEEDSGFIDMDTFYMSFAGSYLAVVLAIVAILFINPYWRRAWFHLIEVFLTSSYYFVVDNLVCLVRGFLWK